MRRALARGLTVVAAALAGAAVLVGLTDSTALSIGSIAISLTHPSFALTEAAIVAIAAVLAFGGETHARRWALLAASVLLLASLAAGSAPRRVGDGYEYLAMAWNMAHARPPALTVDEDAEFRRQAGGRGWVSADYPGSELIGSGPRRDFLHFWLYSLIAAPAVAVALALGANPNHGISAINILLLTTAGVLAARRWPVTPVLVLLAGPILWSVDKAHAEPLLVAGTLGAIALIDTQPAIALMCAAVATAQNPALVIVLVVVAVLVCWSRRAGAIPWTALGFASAVAALNPLYYLLRLGDWTPLHKAVARTIPGLRSVITPVIDPNLGLLEAMPFAAALAVAGLWLYAAQRGGQSRSERLALMAGAIAAPLLLVLVALIGNVNHGATPGPSRYGLWLLPLAMPAIAIAVAWCESRQTARDVVATLLVASLAWAAYAYHPRRPEGTDPTILAKWLWHAHPGFDNPLPEVFVERTMASDGISLPVTTERCEKVLLLRTTDGRSPWPMPCAGGPVPEQCYSAQDLCYANRDAGGAYSFASAPYQPGLGAHAVEDWNESTGRAALARLAPTFVVSSFAVVRAGRPDSLVRAAVGVRWVHPLQSATGLVAWVVPVPGPGPAFVDVWAPAPAQLHLTRTDGVKLVPSRRVDPGRVRVLLPTDRTSIVVLEPQ